MDARQLKTRAALSEAVLDLASLRPVRELSVSAIAARAGIHRSTFYEYAQSPVELLEYVLQAELDQIRYSYLPERKFATDDYSGSTSALVSKLIEAVLIHVDQKAAVYCNAMPELHTMLSRQFQESTLYLLEWRALSEPPIEGIDPAVARQASARYVADGTVGVLELWLETPEPRDVAAFVRLITALLPEWWPGIDIG